MKRHPVRIAIAITAVLAITALGGWALPAQHAAAQTQAATGKGNDKTVTIYLTRHGQTILNTLARVQGWTDSPLIQAGRALPVTVGQNIRAREGAFDAAYSADMKRHLETAQLILQGAGQAKLPVTQLAGLREIDFGRYEGAENKEMWTAIVEHLGYTIDHSAPAQAPADATGQNGGWQTMQGIATAQQGLDAMMAAMKAVASQPAENGAVLPAEDCSDVNTRMSADLDKIAQDAAKHNERRVLVLSSGLSISCFLTNSLHTTVVGGIANVGVSKLQYSNGAWQVLTVNDKSYQQ